MLETLRTWLNGTREYYSGVVIYESIGKNEDLLTLLKKGHNDFRERRLREELLSLCQKLKEKQNGKNTYHATATSVATIKKSNEKDPYIRNNNCKASSQESPVNDENKNSVNEDLYNACKLEADKLYKQTMNDRAVLFALTKTEAFEDPNIPDRIQARSKLALDVVQGYQFISHLYDQADYVKTHGHLPDQGEAEVNEYDHLADGLVKQTLDNLRKNYNKIIKREQTPERVSLQQKHELNIKKLEARWLLLKPI